MRVQKGMQEHMQPCVWEGVKGREMAQCNLEGFGGEANLIWGFHAPLDIAKS